MLSLPDRVDAPELMDDPALAADQHHDALDGLAGLNGWSATTRLLWQPIRELSRELRGRPIRILDVATGAGDMPLRLWRRAKREGIAVDIAGCDISELAVQHANARARRAGAPLRFFQLDALRDPLPAGYDAIVASLFLHHLQPGQIVGVLRRCAEASEHLVLATDLARSAANIVLISIAVRVLSRSPVVHVDGARSIRRAYTAAEIRELAQAAGLGGPRVTTHWPAHLRLAWRRC